MSAFIVNVPGPISFQYLQTINGILYDACHKLHLLEDYNHWNLTLIDAVLSSFSYHIHQLFAILLTTCLLSETSALWDKFKDSMSENILHRIWIGDQNPNIDFLLEIYNEALI